MSNESDEPVYFDNVQVAQNHGRILEENHYYSYGLRIAGISSRKLSDPSEGHLDNQNLYNDKELTEDADVDWYDYGFRSYDAQIGRFMQLDPLTDDYPFLTPYQYASCDPITNIDLDGLEGVGSVLGWIDDAVVTSASNLAPVVVTSSARAATATVVKASGSIGFAVAGVATRAAGETMMRVAAREGVEQGAKVVAMKVAENPSFWSKALPWLGRAAGTVGLVLTPMPAPSPPNGDELYYSPGHPGYSGPVIPMAKFRPAPNPTPNPDPQSGGDDDDDDMVTLYRGVHAKHPGLVDAKMGIARPYGGHDNPEAHNMGNYKSNFTSWSYSKGVAQFQANKEGPGGIILTRKFKRWEIINSPDGFNELEVLIRGTVTGAIPELAKPGGTPRAF